MVRSESEPPTPLPGAVFLSYAHEDADAACRIADALRAAGVEVWFDQRELRGGDAWDQKIRSQIRDCALFLPVISAVTQERAEGYFRLEWKLAAERTHLMADGVPFIVPIDIDGAAEGGAAVPIEFMRVQWTRLADGRPTPDFISQVKRLLTTPRKPVGVKSKSGRSDTLSPYSEPEPENSRSVAAPMRRVALVVAAVLVLAVGAYLGLQSHEKSVVPPPAAPSKSSSAGPASPDGAVAKSVAVLAFENRSGEKDNEYFSDGITDELLTLLQQVPGLRVAARASAFSFKGKNATAQEIGAALSVAHLVEGSVQKIGTRVKISARLSRVATGDQIWAYSDTREWAGIFALQDEIAALIAKNLQVQLGASPRAARVVNPEAHRLVLEGRYFWNLRNETGFTRAEAAFAKALEIDPLFAEAHSGLAGVCVIRATYRQMDQSGVIITTDTERARREASRAIELDPGLAEAYAALGFGLMLDREWTESERQFQKALALNPQSGITRVWHGLYLLTLGRLEAALEEYALAVKIDPLAFINLHMYVHALISARRFELALQLSERAAALRPDVFVPLWGDRAKILFGLGRRPEAIEAARFVRKNRNLDTRWQADVMAIWVLDHAGEKKEAAEYGAEELARLPTTGPARGYVLGALGRFDESLAFWEHIGTTQFRVLCWDPIWDPWRADPRFRAHLEKMGIAELYDQGRAELARLLKAQGANK